MKKIKKCPVCSGYTLSSTCKTCGKETVSPHPAKYSPEDRYGRYRRRQMDKHTKGEL